MNVDRMKNEARGRRGTAKESLYFGVLSSTTDKNYGVTLNYDTGHWCECRGMTSKVRKFGAVGTLDGRNSNHWCKHVNEARSPAAFELRIEARRIRNKTFGVHEAPTDPETGRTVDEGPVSNRRKAVAATKAKAGDKSAAERLAEIDAEREALLAEINESSKASKAVSALISEHGLDAIRKAIEKAS